MELNSAISYTNYYQSSKGGVLLFKFSGSVGNSEKLLSDYIQMKKRRSDDRSLAKAFIEVETFWEYTCQYCKKGYMESTTTASVAGLQ